MRKYEIVITETLSKTIIVEAENESEAMYLAEDNYNDGLDEYILTADDFSNVEINCSGEEREVN